MLKIFFRTSLIFFSIGSGLLAAETAEMFQVKYHNPCACSILSLSKTTFNEDGGKNISQKKPASYLFIAYGGNPILFNSTTPNTHLYAIYSPFPFIEGIGLKVGCISEGKLRPDQVSLYYFQPFLNLPFRYFAFRLGINSLRILEGEGPDGLLLPSFELKIGKIRKYYFSVAFLSEIFSGMSTFSLNYFFKDNVSSLMFGRSYALNGQHFGNVCKFDYSLYKRLMLRIVSVTDFSKGRYGIQLGIGLLL